MLIGARVVSGAHRTYPVVAVAHDAAAGTVLAAADLRVVQVRLSERAVYLATLDDGIGRQLSRPLVRGELVPRSALGEMKPHIRIALTFARDAAPALNTGQRIKVWLSATHCPPVLVVDDVVVQDVRDGSSSFEAGTAQTIDVDVSPESAERIVIALSRPDSALRAGVLTGASDSSDGDPLAPIGCPGSGQSQ